jgi:Arc/MetJ-type ribon-helix-helix transcriptional regulator
MAKRVVTVNLPIEVYDTLRFLVDKKLFQNVSSAIREILLASMPEVVEKLVTPLDEILSNTTGNPWPVQPLNMKAPKHRSRNPEKACQLVAFKCPTGLYILLQAFAKHMGSRNLSEILRTSILKFVGDYSYLQKKLRGDDWIVSIMEAVEE